MTGMKLDEEFGPDRTIEVETDDEENQAQRVNDDDDDDDDDDETQSDSSNSSEEHSNNYNDNSSPSWPQSYRQSMDMFTGMTPPPLSFLKGTSFLTSAYKRSQFSIGGSSLSKPLISDLDKDEVPTSTFPVKSSSGSTFSLIEALPTQLCSYSQSVLTSINVLCGIGLLSTPYAVKEGGWSSLLLLFILGIIACYTGILLKHCLDSSPGLQTYPDIGKAAFGIAGRICIAIVLYVYLYASCVEYLIMMSDNLSKLFPNAHMNLAGIYLNSFEICALTSTILILPTVWLRNLSILSFISVGGVVTLVLVVLCLLWVGVVDDVGFHSSGTALDLAKFPVTVGLFGFCYGSHAVVPNIYSSMKEPSRFPSVLVISFGISWFLYTGVAICGFLMFGETVKSQFTLNMPTKLVASNVAAWAVVAAPVTRYALTITPVAFGIEELLPSDQQRSYAVSVLIRTTLVISTLVVSLTVPYFGFVMALIGSLLVMLIALIFPCACYLSILHDQLSKSQIAVCICIIIVGVVCSIIGTYSAITNIGDNKN